MTTKKKVGMVGAILAVGLPGLVNGAPLAIVEDGQARATIIAAANDRRAPEAAQALQKYLEKMGGATLEIIEEGAEPSQKIRIYVGHTRQAAVCPGFRTER